jgi:hypothetical protein
VDLHRLADGLGAEFEDDKVVFYNTQPKVPSRLWSLTDEQMTALIEAWTDGYCPVCGVSIPQHHVTCESCARDAAHTWGIS